MNDKIKLRYQKSQLDENSLQAMLNHIRRMNQCDVLETIYGETKGNNNSDQNNSLIAKKINDAIVKAYPEYNFNRSEVDTLFLIYTTLLQYSDSKCSVALGKMLQYIDYVKENMTVDIKRQMGTCLLENTKYPDTLPFSLKGDTNDVVRKIQKIQTDGLKTVRNQIAFANINKDVVEFYEHSTKVEIDLINLMLKYLKEAGKAFNTNNIRIANTNDEKLKTRYTNLNTKGLAEVRRGLTVLKSNIRSNVDNYGCNSILVDFIQGCYVTFIKYFETHDSLSDGMNWFINEFNRSASTYDTAIKANIDEYKQSSFGFNFRTLEIKTITPFTNHQLKTINYDNLSRKLNEGSSR